MLLFEFRILPLERLQLRDLASWARRRCFRWSSAESTVFQVLPPLREHEGVNLECGGDGLHLNPRLLTQANGCELKLVAVSVDLPWTGSWHDTSSIVR